MSGTERTPAFSGRYPFSLEMQVRGFDCDGRGLLRAGCALRYLQEAAGGHLESLGLGYQRLFEEGVFFVLTGQAFRVLRPPHRGERLTAATGPIAPAGGVRMFRETVLIGEDGVLCAESQSAWALLDVATGRPLRPSRFGHRLPLLGGEWKPFADPAHLRIPEPQQPCGEREVRASDLDVNRHMNNAVYADLALDCFPDELLGSGGVGELRICYRRQARLGEHIALRRDRQGAWFLAGGSVDGQPCFSAEFSLIPLATDADRC